MPFTEFKNRGDIYFLKLFEWLKLSFKNVIERIYSIFYFTHIQNLSVIVITPSNLSLLFLIIERILGVLKGTLDFVYVLKMRKMRTLYTIL